MKKDIDHPVFMARKAGQGDLPVLLEWYSTQDARRFLYAAPANPEEFASYILKPHRFMVCRRGAGASGGEVGTFSLGVNGETASVGVFISEEHRGRGYLPLIFPLIAAEARAVGARVLRADIYSDNVAALRGFGAIGFRKFAWFEKVLEPGDGANG